MIIAWIPNERGLTRQDVGEEAIPSNAVWIDVVDITPGEKQRIEALGIELPSRAEMQEIEASSRLYREGDAAFMTATMLIKTETPAPETSAVTFILTKTLLLTLRYDEPWTFRVFPQRAPKCGAHSAEQAFTAILDTTIERLADLLELVSVELEHISQQVFRRPGLGKQHTASVDLQRTIHGLGRCGNIAGKVRESLVDKLRLLTFAEQSSHEPDSKARILALERDIQSLSEYAAFTAGKISFLLDATLGLINNNVNQEMKRMSAIMIAVMWPALVSGFFAMNVNLPFPQQGAMWPFFLCVFLAFGPLIGGFLWWWKTKRR